MMSANPDGAATANGLSPAPPPPNEAATSGGTGRNGRRRRNRNEEGGRAPRRPIVQVVYQLVQSAAPPRSAAADPSSAAPRLPPPPLREHTLREHTFRVPATAAARVEGDDDGGGPTTTTNLVAPHDVRVPNPAFLLPPVSSSSSSDDDEVAGGAAAAETAGMLHAEQQSASSAAALHDFRGAWIPAPAFGAAIAVVMAVCLMIACTNLGVDVFELRATAGVSRAAIGLWSVEVCRDVGLARECESYPFGDAKAAAVIADSCVPRVRSIAACCVLLVVACAATVALGLAEAARREPFPFAASAGTAISIILAGCVWGIINTARQRDECPYTFYGSTVHGLSVAVFIVGWVALLLHLVRLMRLDWCEADVGAAYQLERDTAYARAEVRFTDGRRDDDAQDGGAEFQVAKDDAPHVGMVDHLLGTWSMCGITLAFCLALAALLTPIAEDSHHVLLHFDRMTTCASSSAPCITQPASQVVGARCASHMAGASSLLTIACVVIAAAFIVTAFEMAGRPELRIVAACLCMAASAICISAVGVMQRADDVDYCLPFLRLTGPSLSLAAAAAGVLATAPIVFYRALFRHAGWSLHRSIHSQLRAERAVRIVRAKGLCLAPRGANNNSNARDEAAPEPAPAAVAIAICVGTDAASPPSAAGAAVEDDRRPPPAAAPEVDVEMSVVVPPGQIQASAHPTVR